MKRLNVNEFIWFIILLSFTFYLYNLFSTGKIYFYIHPKMAVQVSFSLYGFALLTLFQVRKLFKKSSHLHLKLGFIVFIIPLALGFAVNPQSISIDVASQKGVLIVGTESFKCSEPSHDSHLIRYYVEEDNIEIDENNFMHEIENIVDDIEESMGKSITLSGFIYNDEKLKGKEFLVSRMLISCCAADAQVVGIMCRAEGKIPVNGQWVKICGRLSSTKYVDRHSGAEYTIPLILIDKLEDVKKPDNQYIYY